MTSMKAIASAALVLFVLPVAAHGLAASEDFDGIIAQIVFRTDHFNNDSTTDWDFTQATMARIAVAGQNNGGTFTNGLTNQYLGDQAIFLNYDGISPANGGGTGHPGPSTGFGFHQSDGDHFALDSFQLGNNLVGYSLSVTITVLRDSTTLGSGTFDLNTSSTSDGITYTYDGDSSGGSARPYGTLTLDGRYANATNVELDYAGAATPLIDNVEVSAPDMTAPTVTATSLLTSYVGTGPSGFAVTFNEPVNDPPGDGDSDDVTNPANFLLVEAGTNATFDTVSCAGGRVDDDRQVPVAGVTYDSGSLTATVSLGGPLPAGTYRLFVCGTTSITDLARNQLNGGSDSTFDLAVLAITEVPALGRAGLSLLALLLAAGALMFLRR